MSISSKLFTQVNVGELQLNNRAVMAPMTHSRAHSLAIHQMQCFLKEVVDAIALEVGAERTANRLAPFLTIHGMDILPAILNAATYLAVRGMACLHLVDADWEDAPEFTEAFRQDIRDRFSLLIIVAGKYDQIRADWVLNNGYADLVAYGRPFVANPDLPRRLADGLPLANFDASTLFGGAGQGYIDYPAWDK